MGEERIWGEERFNWTRRGKALWDERFNWRKTFGVRKDLGKENIWGRIKFGEERFDWMKALGEERFNWRKGFGGGKNLGEENIWGGKI